eukprot:CAMPEP_0172721546 /NCGR_PEP_ID=MMETSP1074-20121228/79325_1 /TAXON_ID=2916 /ORGANISM="Ceratium fusus, Strain PA161109" /LENGTH=82 /DNA_ID=CAMNT_0013547305 /DNA_START=55 /DNA_END=303 /DNA_ORIENTATION=+
MTKEEFTQELLKMLNELDGVEVKANSDLEEAGVDSMDAGGIQKKIVDQAPESAGKIGMNKGELKLMLDGFKTVDQIATKLAA